MTLNEFFTDSPWLAWPLAVLYAALCVAIALLIVRLFRRNRNY